MDIVGFLSGLNLDQMSAIVFLVIIGVLCYIKRDKIQIQKVAGYFIYVILYRTNLGIRLMDRMARRHRELIKLFGYICIGLGFMGMIFISLNMLMLLFMIFKQPEVAEKGVTLVLPFTNMPGVGYLSFWHWIIGIFFLAVIHEFSHGVVARAHNLKVSSSGFALFSVLIPIIPAAFVEPDEKKMAKKGDVVQYSVFAAGPMINIIVAALLLIALPYVGKGLLHQGDTLAPFEGRISEPVGFSYTLIQNGSLPASRAGLPNSSVISGFNGENIDTYNDFARDIYMMDAGTTVNVTVNETVYSISSTSHPEDPGRAYIGIRPEANERRVQEGVAEWKSQTFYWFKGLIKWIFIFNFAIGLVNLLPLGIVDGGRMLGVALDKIIADKERARKIWSYIGMFFLAILLLGLFIRYVFNPFTLG